MIIAILALYNINLLTELNWEWRQIRHATVKKCCVIIYCIQLFPLDISPWKTTPWTTSPYKIFPKKITLRTFAPWIITPE